MRGQGGAKGNLCRKDYKDCAELMAAMGQTQKNTAKHRSAEPDEPSIKRETERGDTEDKMQKYTGKQ